MHADSAIIVSYYDAREPSFLLSLLNQIETIDAGAKFDLFIVINQHESVYARRAPELSRYRTFYRENRGFNIGAWQHGWLNAKQYKYYLFLQDECKIEKEGWLRAFIEKSSSRACVVGESLIINPRADQTHGLWEGSLDYMADLKRRLGVAISRDWTHVQTTIIFACAEVLEHTQGFVVPDSNKMHAIASEMAFSMLVREHGFPIYQLAFLPFEYISHPQWSNLRKKMITPFGRIRRITKIVLRGRHFGR